MRPVRVPCTVTRDDHGDLPACGQKRAANAARHPIDARRSRRSPCVPRLDEKSTEDRRGSVIRAHIPRVVCPDRGVRRGSHDIDGTLSGPECVRGTTISYRSKARYGFERWTLLRASRNGGSRYDRRWVESIWTEFWHFDVFRSRAVAGESTARFRAHRHLFCTLFADRHRLAYTS